MDTGPEESLFLNRVLADLDAQRARASEQELCVAPCARMEAAHLAELHALLFRAAGPEPHDGRSKRRTLAADFVAVFEAARAGGGGTAPAEERERGGRGPVGPHPCHGYVDPPWPGTSESDFRLVVGGRAASLDKLHHLPRYSPSRQGPPPPPREPRPPFCLQKRNDFRKMAALHPQASAFDRRPGPAPFFTRSSEAAYENPCRAPGLHERRRRVKQESLDDLQAPADAGPAIKSLSLNVDDQQAGPRRGRFRSPKRAESADGWDARVSVGTQTERKGPAGSGVAPSDRDSEPPADDISDMFRFLDEMSACGSPGMVASSCYDSAGSLGSDSSKSWAERGADRLLRSLDGELKASVGQLAARMGRIESELESLSAVRGEIAQVLGKLNKMDCKMRRPPDAADGGARQRDAPGSSSWQRSAAAAAPPPVFRRHTLTSADAEPKKAAARLPKMDDAGARDAALGHRRTSARSCRGKHGVRREETTGRDVAVQAESVSADELAFWLEDVRTPGYDSLLKRREAEFRRAKMCKLAALIAATLGVILVIVVPVCTAKP